MATVGSDVARIHLTRLLARVEQGETIRMTRHGKPVARLVPATATAPRPEIAAAIDAMEVFQKREAPTLGDDLSIRPLIDEGRRR